MGDTVMIFRYAQGQSMYMGRLKETTTNSIRSCRENGESADCLGWSIATYSGVKHLCGGAFSAGGTKDETASCSEKLAEHIQYEEGFSNPSIAVTIAKSALKFAQNAEHFVAKAGLGHVNGNND